MYKNLLTKKTIIILTLCVLLLAVVQYFVMRDIKMKNENISNMSIDLDFQTDREEYILSTGKIIQNIDSDLKKIDDSIISSSGDAKFLEGLESMAKVDNIDLSIEALSLEDIGKSTTSPIMVFKIKAKTVDGSWSGTYKMLKQLESMPVKVKINSFNFYNSATPSSDSKEVYKPQWQSKFDINVLKYK